MEPTTIYPILLGLALAASTGLNTFLPLLTLSAASYFKLVDSASILNGSFAWIASPAALMALGLATTVEVIGDKIPIVDHALDSFGTLARPVVGAFATASVFTQGDPAMAAIAGLVVGAPVAFGFHAAKAGTRAASTTTTFGVGNPVLSFFEDIAAMGMTVVGLMYPWMVPFLLVVAALIMWRLFVTARKTLSGARGLFSRPKTSAL